MRYDLVTLFPELFEGFLATSFVARALASNTVSVRRANPRDFGLGKHRNVDDTPYGGGSGMVMRVDVVTACIESLDTPTRPHRILMTPQGKPFAQADALRLSKLPAIALISGRYEGFDERIRAQVDEEISLGDFVMTGGEVAAMAIMEATVRLLPGVLGNEGSLSEESHGESGLLEYPHYTRPAEFRGMGIPEVLLSGNHEKIAKWRLVQSQQRTETRRPDLLAKKVTG
jgi:tRNA (guanine37-N1)-methyltransferase